MSNRSLNVVVAPDSFGGALDSVAVAEAIARGWRSIRPGDRVTLIPMADGGEGTLAALKVALGPAADQRPVETVDPLGRPVTATFLLLDEGRRAFIEMASASGLAPLAPKERTPDAIRRATTRGTGDLVRAALEAGVERITIGLGGSGTNDAGAGIITALGAQLLDRDGRELPDGGASLANVARVETDGLDPRLAAVHVEVASDVTNVLCGPHGASAVYGPQKGADPATVEELDRALARWGDVMEATTGRVVANMPGAGAAGGTAATLMGYTDAVLRPGVEVVAELVGLTRAIDSADLVITGEGRADEQTLSGKAAMGVASLARPRRTPVVLLCGALGPGAEALDAAPALTVVQPIADRPMDLPSAIADTARLLENAAERVARTIGIGFDLASR
jgi:glycerate 2-kinase